MKAFKKAPKNIQTKTIQRIKLFLDSPQNPKLNVHELRGKLRGIKSLNITGDWRIWFMEEAKDEGTIILLYLGTHSKLY